MRLFDRNTCSARLTHAGQEFLEKVPLDIVATTQSLDSVRALSAGDCAIASSRHYPGKTLTQTTNQALAWFPDRG